MTQEDKQLLLIDLCARLPYNLYVRIEEFNVPKNEAITEGFVGNYLKDNRCNYYNADDILNEFADGCINIKPYLRLMSGMTEEEVKELSILYGLKDILSTKITDEYINVVVDDGFCNTETRTIWCNEMLFSIEVFDWLNAHNFDYRELIKKGLALEAPKEMYNNI